MDIPIWHRFYIIWKSRKERPSNRRYFNHPSNSLPGRTGSPMSSLLLMWMRRKFREAQQRLEPQGCRASLSLVALEQNRQSENGLTGNKGRRTVQFVQNENNIFPLGPGPALRGGTADEASK